MLKLKRYKGFTLVEVILVILIIGILAGIVIPRIMYSSNTAKTEACNANVATMNTMIEFAYVKDGVAYPAGTFADFGTSHAAYFPDGLPACPHGTAYTISGGRVQKHGH